MSLRRVLILSVASASVFACGGSDPESSGTAGAGVGGSFVGPTGSGSGSGAAGGAGAGTGTGAGPSSGTGGSSGGSTPVPSGPVDCSGITQAGYELCSSGPTFCAAVFTDSAGCAAVCAAAGLTCSEVYDNEDECSADMSSSALSCAGTGHESDYCVCTGTGGAPVGSGGTGSGSGGTGNVGSGGTGTAGTGNTGSGGTGNSGPTGSTCSSISEFGTVNSTIVVKGGETYDGGCKRFKAGSSLGNGSQDEGQDPVFVLEDGATLKNVVLGFPAADGIHTEGDANLYNIHWEDIGEDALTIEGSGTVVLDGGSAYKGADKTFQINAASTFRVSNFKASDAGKFIRQNGGTMFKVSVFIDKCDISNMKEAIFRTDSSSSTVSMTNTRFSDIGESNFIGVSSGNITTSNNTEY
jgi:hypothetical protein